MKMNKKVAGVGPLKNIFIGLASRLGMLKCKSWVIFWLSFSYDYYEVVFNFSLV